ncbi:hypothetical protein LP316_13360 [Thalassotalea sp. LPB0316]|uniref:hypothetical protein n=1 Tax=Thalassotalea sp. LPB0316 TaxID=2769490 RepID=UPI00186760D6|nr:hypothetical protein [Thalassotalea sp. LPB0316]QOL25272.1 hypothetical protein LP316_13360 [Thalassotalea sp. LPB0316]
MNKDVKKLLNEHQQLIHSESKKVTSHVQRDDGDWFVNTLMLEGVDSPFKYKRKQPYRSLKGSRVNLTYYRATEVIAGFEMEYMKVVRVKTL